MRGCIMPTRSIFVLRKSPFNIISHSGVQTAIVALKYIDVIHSSPSASLRTLRLARYNWGLH